MSSLPEMVRFRISAILLNVPLPSLRHMGWT